LSTKNLLNIPGPSPASARSPQAQMFELLLTPTSSAPAIFDSPLKSSPSSSVSTPNSLALVQRVNTPIAELEDTSLAYSYRELEDTSRYAIRSQCQANMSSYAMKSGHPNVSKFFLSNVEYFVLKACRFISPRQIAFSN
jgi:hypothetical protein